MRNWFKERGLIDLTEASGATEIKTAVLVMHTIGRC